MSTTPLSALDMAIASMGGTVAAAATLKLKSYQVLQQWRTNGVPSRYRPAIERHTNGSVRVESLGDDAVWHRVKDRTWPWNGGRPTLDVARMEAA